MKPSKNQKLKAVVDLLVIIVQSILIIKYPNLLIFVVSGLILIGFAMALYLDISKKDYSHWKITDFDGMIKRMAHKK